MIMFESLVNTEGFQTVRMMVEAAGGLRVLLIQKDFKLVVGKAVQDVRLRVLLIQKDFKHLAQNQR